MESVSRHGWIGTSSSIASEPRSEVDINRRDITVGIHDPSRSWCRGADEVLVSVCAIDCSPDPILAILAHLIRCEIFSEHCTIHVDANRLELLGHPGQRAQNEWVAVALAYPSKVAVISRKCNLSESTIRHSAAAKEGSDIRGPVFV